MTRKHAAKDVAIPEWEPTAKMRNFFRAWKEGVGTPIAKILESAGLSTSWYYDEFQADPRAQQWLKDERDKFLASPALNDVHDQVYRGAVTPSSTQHQFQKLFMQRFDPKFVERKESRQTIDIRLHNGLSAEDRLQVLSEAFAKARGLPEGEDEDVVDGEIVAEQQVTT